MSLRRVRYHVVLLVLSALAIGIGRCESSNGADRLALLIGNSEYENSPLKNPGNDVALMKSALDRLGFKSRVHRDVTLSQMEGAVRDFRRRIGKGDLCLFYYAGHGVQLDGTNYLVPLKFGPLEEHEVKYKMMNLGMVLDALDTSKANCKVVVLDCCRDNPFGRSWSRSLSAGLAGIGDVPEGTILAYSTAPGKTAPDGDGRTSAYTNALVRALSERPTRGLEVIDVFRKASRNVYHITRQQPWISFSAALPEYFLWEDGQRDVTVDISSSISESFSTESTVGTSTVGGFGLSKSSAQSTGRRDPGRLEEWPEGTKPLNYFRDYLPGGEGDETSSTYDPLADFLYGDVSDLRRPEKREPNTAVRVRIENLNQSAQGFLYLRVDSETQKVLPGDSGTVEAIVPFTLQYVDEVDGQNGYQNIRVTRSGPTSIQFARNTDGDSYWSPALQTNRNDRVDIALSASSARTYQPRFTGFRKSETLAMATPVQSTAAGAQPAVAGSVFATQPTYPASGWSYVGDVGGIKVYRDNTTGLEWTETLGRDVRYNEAAGLAAQYGFRLPSVGEFNSALNSNMRGQRELGYRSWFFWTNNPNAVMSIDNPGVNPAGGLLNDGTNSVRGVR